MPHGGARLAGCPHQRAHREVSFLRISPSLGASPIQRWPEEAKRIIARWILWYNHERPHQSLGYLSPREYRSQQSLSVA
ncbi:MAG: transposase [Planctomycetes bacterium]|nr:transposase [Planctomycetota bacterium]